MELPHKNAAAIGNSSCQTPALHPSRRGAGFVDTVRYEGTGGHHRALGCSSQQPGHCSSPALLQGPPDDSAAQGALHHVSNLIPANPSRPWAPSPQHRQHTQRWKRHVKH